MKVKYLNKVKLTLMGDFVLLHMSVSGTKDQGTASISGVSSLIYIRIGNKY